MTQQQTSLDVLTLIPEDQMAASGWEGAGFRGDSPAGRVVANWHDEHHAGAYSTCQDALCLAVKRVDG